MTDPTPPEQTPADDATTPAARPRPAAPGAAAARRARQLGGTRRPSPRPDAADTGAGTGTGTAGTGSSTPTTPSLAKPSAAKPSAAKPSAAKAGTKTTRTEPAAAPKSSVGKAAARPRPRPRPTPEAAGEPTSDADGTPSGRPARRGLLAVASVLTVLFLAAGVVFLVLSLRAQPTVSAAETSRAVSAAKTDVALLTTYGYQTIDADAAKAADVITGQFKQQYLDAVEKSVKPQLPTSQAVTTGQVDTAGLVSADARGRQVVVLVYGQQSVTNKVQTTPRIDAFQVRVTMQKVGDDWLVSSLEQLGNNA